MSTVGLEEYVNVTTAADIIGVTVGRIRQMLISQTLRGEKVNDRAWVVDRTDAERVAKVEHKGGRQRSRPVKKRRR